MQVNNEKGQNEKLLPLRWTSNNFAAKEWNSLDLSLREAASLSSFKRHPSKVTLKVPVSK